MAPAHNAFFEDDSSCQYEELFSFLYAYQFLPVGNN